MENVVFIMIDYEEDSNSCHGYINPDNAQTVTLSHNDTYTAHVTDANAQHGYRFQALTYAQTEEIVRAWAQA